MPDPREVRAMFARIAGRYDLLNRVLSAGIDRSWRKAMLSEAGPVQGGIVVDACCGTGDVTRTFARAGALVLGVDFTPEMLERAVAKREAATFVAGDAQRLPLADGKADVATVAFGIRNVESPRRSLAELVRVVRPGGLVLVLEFGMPRGRVLAPLYRAYFTRVLPRIGGWITGDPGAYRYLPDTVVRWQSPDEFVRLMQESGLVECVHRPLSAGIATLFRGRVPA